MEVPLLVAERLLETYDSDPSVREIVDGCELWIVPLLNPDGLEYSIGTYRYWRKNRRDNGDGSFGVDLNRNYGQAWGLDDVGSSSDPSSGVFRGRSAFSEPETAALRDLVLGRGFDAVVSYHSFGQLILYPWAYTAAPAPLQPVLEALGRDMAVLIAAVGGRAYAVGQSGEDLYLSNGDAADWAYAELGVPAYTIELPPRGSRARGIHQRGGGHRRYFQGEPPRRPGARPPDRSGSQPGRGPTRYPGRRPGGGPPQASNPLTAFDKPA